MPGELLGGVQALERLEQLVGVGRVEARAVVAHEEDALAVALGSAPNSMCAVLAAGGELPGVAEQVLQDDVDERPGRRRRRARPGW